MDAIQSLESLLIFDLDSRICVMALEIFSEKVGKRLGSRDCAILATMKVAGVERIATHDAAFKAVRGIRVVDDIPTPRT